VVAVSRSTDPELDTRAGAANRSGWTLSDDQPFVIPLDQAAEPAWVKATPLAGSKESPADASRLADVSPAVPEP
jgi:hypothetical protein